LELVVDEDANQSFAVDEMEHGAVVLLFEEVG
jgi:hypothetical protein